MTTYNIDWLPYPSPGNAKIPVNRNWWQKWCMPKDRATPREARFYAAAINIQHAQFGVLNPLIKVLPLRYIQSINIPVYDRSMRWKKYAYIDDVLTMTKCIEFMDTVGAAQFGVGLDEYTEIYKPVKKRAVLQMHLYA